MKISIFNTQKALPISKTLIRKVCELVAAAENEEFAEVTIHFITKKKIAVMHGEFFDDPSPTDCISFPIDEKGVPYRVLGEVFVSPEVAIGYCSVNGGDPLQETVLYVVHGLLHLFGYDDMTTKKRNIMKEAEKKHMDLLIKEGLFAK